MKRSAEIDGLRFGCNLLVPLIHAGQFPVAIGGIEFGIWSYLGSYFAEAALPTLFLMSGYLFFVGESDGRTLIWKLMRRIRRLLVPFLLWNAVFCALYLFVGHYSPRAAERMDSAGVTSALGFVREVFNFTRPLLYGPLWFLRALFFLAVLGAVVRLAMMRVRKGRFLVYGVFVALALIGSFYWNLSIGVPPYAFALYFLGGLIAEGGRDPTELFRRTRWIWLGFLLAGTSCLFFADSSAGGLASGWKQLVWFVAAFAFWGWARELSFFATNSWCVKWLLPTGFFVYVIHMFINRMVFHAAASHLPAVPGALSVVSLVTLLTSILIPMLIWHGLARILPRLTAVLDGR